jgi:hypothetical protein
MAAADHDPPEGSVLMSDEADHEPDADERNQERDRRNKHAAAGTIGNCGANEKAQASQLKQDQEQDYDQAGENQQ